mgnify:CR=1 FL=1
METMRCPYCECKVSLTDVETDDGTCPECGAPLVGSLLFDHPADDMDDDDELPHAYSKHASKNVGDDLDDDIDIDEE